MGYESSDPFPDTLRVPTSRQHKDLPILAVFSPPHQAIESSTLNKEASDACFVVSP